MGIDPKIDAFFARLKKDQGGNLSRSPSVAHALHCAGIYFAALQPASSAAWCADQALTVLGSGLPSTTEAQYRSALKLVLEYYRKARHLPTKDPLAHEEAVEKALFLGRGSLIKTYEHARSFRSEQIQLPSTLAQESASLDACLKQTAALAREGDITARRAMIWAADFIQSERARWKPLRQRPVLNR